MNPRLAYFLSVILHPLLMPTILFALLFFLAPSSLGIESFNSGFKWFILGIIFVYTFVLPSYLIYLLKRWGFIESFELEKLSDRRLPYFLTAIIYASIGYFIYIKSPLLFHISYLLWSIAVVILLIAIISLQWKISAHSAGIGGVIGAIGGLVSRMGESNLFVPMLCLIIFAGFLSSARLQLKAHTPDQVGAGAVLGVMSSFVAVMLLF